MELRMMELQIAHYDNRWRYVRLFPYMNNYLSEIVPKISEDKYIQNRLVYITQTQEHCNYFPCFYFYHLQLLKQALATRFCLSVF